MREMRVCSIFACALWQGLKWTSLQTIIKPDSAGAIVSAMKRTHGLHLLNGPYARAEATIVRDHSHSGKWPCTSNHFPSLHDVLFIISCMHHPFLDQWALSFSPWKLLEYAGHQSRGSSSALIILLEGWKEGSVHWWLTTRGGGNVEGCERFLCWHVWKNERWALPPVSRHLGEHT